METKSAAFSAAVPVLELLDKHNYTEWEIRVRTYLTGQNLWKDIIDDNQVNAAAEPSRQENDDEDLWKRRNYMALHVIQISCGPDAFSEISHIRSAKTAWKNLKTKYLPRHTGNIDSSYLQYAELYKAVLRGNLTAVKDFLDSHDMAVSMAITDKGETALHIAVTAGHAHIVQALVDRMSEANLRTPDSDGYTALMTAVVHGRYQLAECMLKDKGRNLISIRENRGGNLPVVMAIDFGQIEIARYLYPLTSLNDLKPAKSDHNGAKFLTRAIYTINFDLALDLIRRCQSLTLALDDRSESPFFALASMPHAFPSGNRLVWWKQCIFSRIRIDGLDPSTSETCLSIPDVENGRQRNQVTKIGSVPEVLLRHLVSIVCNFLGTKQLYERKKIHMQSKELLSRMYEEIAITRTQQLASGRVYDAINLAVKNGIFEFVSTIVKKDPRLILENEDRDLRNIFMLAVLYRQSKIFSLIYGLPMKKTLTSYGDRNDDNILHMVGIIEDSTRLNRSAGAALQMQRELQWFKEVEKIVNPKIKEGTNKDNLTPRQLFTKNHENMMEKGEKWMKDTASSCTVVGALIATIMFAVAFTVPGGNDQTTGFPIFFKKKLFMLFIISDALSLFSSSTSVLMFLGILTSRYAEEDFLEYLPRQMIIGLLTLFCSIATMMIAFSGALLIMLHEKLWIAIPLICLASVPVTFFIWIQFPILRDMIISTYGPSIFNKKNEKLITVCN